MIDSGLRLETVHETWDVPKALCAMFSLVGCLESGVFDLSGFIFKALEYPLDALYAILRALEYSLVWRYTEGS